MTANPITTSAFGPDPNVVPAEVYPQLLAAITGGNPFANSLTRYASGNTRAVFGVISSVAGASWIAEADPKPDLTVGASSYVATAQELAGIALVSDRAVRDASVDLMGEIQRVLRTYFGRVLDDGLLHGDLAPEPTGVFTFAAAATGPDLWTAVHDAKGQIVTAGGSPSTLALPPAAILAEEARLNGQQEPMYPNGLRRTPGSTWWQYRR